MGMMMVGADRSSFAAASHGADSSEFFDTLYCFAPQDLDRLSGNEAEANSEQTMTAAAVLLAAAQEFVVVGLAELFAFWRQPVTDRVALVTIACLAVGVERRSARFESLDAALDVIAALAERVSGGDCRDLLAGYANRFDRACRDGGGAEHDRLFRCALADLLIDPINQRDHGQRISLLLRDAIESFRRELMPQTVDRLALFSGRGGLLRAA